MTAFEWTRTAEQTLITLWLENRTATQIATVLGLRDRNAVLGKIFRLRKAGRLRGEEEVRKIPASPLWKKELPPRGVVAGVVARRNVAITLSSIRDAIVCEAVEPPPEPPRTTLPAGKPVAFLEAGPRHCRKPLWPDHGHTPLEAKFVCGGQKAVIDSYCPACAPALESRFTGRRAS